MNKTIENFRSTTSVHQNENLAINVPVRPSRYGGVAFVMAPGAGSTAPPPKAPYPRSMGLLPGPVLTNGFCGTKAVLGGGIKVRLKTLTNSARINMLNLPSGPKRKLRPKFRFSVGVRGARKSL